MSGEDTRDYCIGWKPFPCPSSELAFLYSPDAWKFTSGLNLMEFCDFHVQYIDILYICNEADLCFLSWTIQC